MLASKGGETYLEVRVMELGLESLYPGCFVTRFGESISWALCGHGGGKLWRDVELGKGCRLLVIEAMHKNLEKCTSIPGSEYKSVVQKSYNGKEKTRSA